MRENGGERWPIIPGVAEVLTVAVRGPVQIAEGELWRRESEGLRSEERDADVSHSLIRRELVLGRGRQGDVFAAGRGMKEVRELSVGQSHVLKDC